MRAIVTRGKEGGEEKQFEDGKRQKAVIHMGYDWVHRN